MVVVTNDASATSRASAPYISVPYMYPWLAKPIAQATIEKKINAVTTLNSNPSANPHLTDKLINVAWTRRLHEDPRAITPCPITHERHLEQSMLDYVTNAENIELGNDCRY